MKIKEILFDFTSPIDIPTKNLAEDAETILKNFKKALQDKAVKPYDIEKRYRDYLYEHGEGVKANAKKAQEYKDIAAQNNFTWDKTPMIEGYEFDVK